MITLYLYFYNKKRRIHAYPSFVLAIYPLPNNRGTHIYKCEFYYK